MSLYFESLIFLCFKTPFPSEKNITVLKCALSGQNKRILEQKPTRHFSQNYITNQMKVMKQTSDSVTILFTHFHR